MKPNMPESQKALEAEMLPQHPPPQVIRWMASLIIAVCVVAGAALVVVHVPETVRCSFVLVPEKGADPIQAPLLAVVQSVKVTEGQEVQPGAELFVLRSDEIRAWQTQLKTAQEDLRGIQKRGAKSEEYYESQMAIKTQELNQVEQEVAYRQKHLATSQDFLARNQKLAAEKLVSEVELLQYRLAVAESEKDLNVAQRTVQQVTLQRQQLQTERARQRSEEESEAEKLKVRIDAFGRQLENCVGEVMSIRAGYHGVVLSLAHRNAGSVVRNGDELCQLARLEGEPRARLLVREPALPKLAAGQKVRLFFEAFPFQRYGTVTGKLEWLSPAAVNSADGPTFVARATLDETSFKRGAGPDSSVVRPVRVGMKGEARIVVGSRMLIEYAFEPMRQLREQMRR